MRRERRRKEKGEEVLKEGKDERRRESLKGGGE